MKYVIVKFDYFTAICEDENKELFDIPRSFLPFGVSVGSRIVKIYDNVYIIDTKDVEKRKETIRKYMELLSD
jgi:hypothetical protein